MNKGPINSSIISGPTEKQMRKIKGRMKRLPMWAQDYITFLERSNRILKKESEDCQ